MIGRPQHHAAAFMLAAGADFIISLAQYSTQQSILPVANLNIKSNFYSAGWVCMPRSVPFPSREELHHKLLLHQQRKF